MELTGVIEMHVHSAPDIRRRSIDDLELAQEATRAGVRAVVIKSHFVPTMDRAWLAQKAHPGVEMFGGVVLNPSMGGINPAAVDTAIKHGAKIVWLPTLFSARQRSISGKTDGVMTVKDGKVVPELFEIFRLVATNDVILATGHLGPAEIFTVVDAAKKTGVEKILVNHPEHAVVGMSISDQKTLAADYGVYFERCYGQPVGGGKYKTNFSTNLAAIEAVGYESTIVATDGGQVENPPWTTALAEHIGYLTDHGIPQDAMDVMTKINPAKLLNIAERKCKESRYSG